MARPPSNHTPVQMLMALAIVVVPILLISWFFTSLPSEPNVTAVDYRPIAQTARRAAAYDVLTPENLPDGWTCTRARWIPQGEPGPGTDAAPGNTWQLGFLTPARMYIAVDQRDHGQESFVRDVTREGEAVGSSAVAGQEWTRYVSSDSRTQSIVLSREGAVTIVSADLPFEALEAFAGTLTAG